MAQVLRQLDGLRATKHPDLVVGIHEPDDAAVYRVADALALVQSIDFLTPIVDDPADWGRIAAANALSDIYAMGAMPLTALQVVGWPRETLSLELLGEVLEGAAEVMLRAGCTLIGGHSIDDPEPKFGLAVTGLAAPEALVRTRGAEPGSAIVLTKPIGTGVVTTAHKAGAAPTESLVEAVTTMGILNEGAARAMIEVGVEAATDVTGYGLLGHLGGMLGEELGAEVSAGAVPIMKGAHRLASDGHVPGGTKRNLAHVQQFTDFNDLDEACRMLLSDAQTSGGLLIAIAAEKAGDLIAALARSGTPVAATIGAFTSEPGRIRII